MLVMPRSHRPTPRYRTVLSSRVGRAEWIGRSFVHSSLVSTVEEYTNPDVEGGHTVAGVSNLIQFVAAEQIFHSARQTQL